MRGIIIKSGYLGNLKKNIVSSGGEGNFGFSPIARNLPDLFGFKLSKFNRIPNSAERLSGFAVYPSAILVALSPVTPAAEVRRALSSYDTYTDPETNLTLEYRPRRKSRPQKNLRHQLIIMNSQILIGVTRDKKHKVVLDGATYAEIKKAFLGMKTSDEFIKLEIWSRANGLEKSKRLRRAAEVSESNTEVSDVDIEAEATMEEKPESDSEDFNVEEPVKTAPSKKKKGKSS